MQGWKCRGGDSGVEMQGGDAGAEMQGWRCRNKNAGVEMMEWRCRGGDAGVEMLEWRLRGREIQEENMFTVHVWLGGPGLLLNDRDINQSLLASWWSWRSHPSSKNICLLCS